MILYNMNRYKIYRKKKKYVQLELLEISCNIHENTLTNNLYFPNSNPILNCKKNIMFKLGKNLGLNFQKSKNNLSYFSIMFFFFPFSIDL